MSINEMILILDRVGIVAFAFTGVEVSTTRRLDIFGLLVVGVVAATGGGVIRDVLLAQRPFVIEHVDYQVWASGASAVAIFLRMLRWRIPSVLLDFAEAVGIGTFAAAGAVAGVHAGVPPPAAVLLAVVTATGGGVIRDILTDRVPLVRHTEINATAAAAGGLAVVAIEASSTGGSVITGIAVAGILAAVGRLLPLQIPHLNPAAELTTDAASD